MVCFLYVTLILIVVYLLYPVLLFLLPSGKEDISTENVKVDKVSLILFSYNNASYLKAKIDTLCEELSSFCNYELIVIDNGSTDGSLAVLENYKNIDSVKVVHNSVRGVAVSINLGVKIAQYEIIIFCDLRQKLSNNILQKLVEPFKNKKIGAVSSYLSPIDSEGKKSVIRTYENIIKTCESNKGSLIGVYGPLYAIRKECFIEIPDHILLEDLYLSLMILRTHTVVMNKECVTTDELFTEIYNYKRVKCYLRGLIQLIKEKKIFFSLSFKHTLMLILHKYLRLILPILSIISVVFIFFIASGIFFNVTLFSLSFLIFLMIIPGSLSIQLDLRNFFRIIWYYVITFFDLLFKGVFHRRL